VMQKELIAAYAGTLASGILVIGLLFNIVL
jgi:hypothetical protein